MPDTEKSYSNKLKLSRPDVYGIVLLLGLFFISTSSYLRFKEFHPKVLKPLTEIKKTSSDNELLIPFPSDYKKISVDVTADFEQTTFETGKNIKEVIEFYRAAMTARGWEVESEGGEEEFLYIKLKNPSKLLTVNAFKQEDSTTNLVSVEMVKR